MTSWTSWRPMPAPGAIRRIAAPHCPGVYQVRNDKTGELVLCGISKTLQRRMKSLMPAPYGTGRRRNEAKRSYVLAKCANLSYRCCPTGTREEAVAIERVLLQTGTHLFNT